MSINAMKADFSQRVEMDATIDALNAVWTAVTTTKETAVTFPKDWQKFLRMLDETEAYLAAKYRYGRPS